MRVRRRPPGTSNTLTKWCGPSPHVPRGYASYLRPATAHAACGHPEERDRPVSGNLGGPSAVSPGKSPTPTDLGRRGYPVGPFRGPLADWGRPRGVDGTSSSENSRQRPGDGESPGVLSGAKITPEPPEERRPEQGRQVEPAAAATEWVPTRSGPRRVVPRARQDAGLVPSSVSTGQRPETKRTP
jgi:hypothetical protein